MIVQAYSLIYPPYTIKQPFCQVPPMTQTKINAFVNMCVAIVEQPFLKLVGGGFLVVLSFLFNGILKQAMFALFILILADFATAIMAVRKSPTEKIESRRMWVTAGKIAAYYTLVASGNLAEKGTQYILPLIDETILGFLCVTELLSILENIGRMGYAVPKKLIDKLSKYKDSK